MKGKNIPFGYGNGGVVELERLMRERSAYLVDIRLSPRSQFQAFNREALQARFHKRYIHIPELGNVNYRKGQPIQIAHPDRGIERLVNGISQGYTIVLMCGCKEYELCHRHTVVSLLLQAMPEANIELPDRASPENTMKCLSIQQPWSWLIVNGYKEIENRDWLTSYRGPVLIHAGAKLDDDWFTTTGQVEDHHPMRDYVPQDMPQRHDYAIKSIIGMATLADVVEQSSSPWFIGRYGFVLMDTKAFKEPIRYSGSLKLFDVEREVIAHAEVKG